MSYNESSKSPLVPDNLVLNEVIGTAWYSIDSIIAAHDAGSLALSHTGLKCWEISLYTTEQLILNFVHVHQLWYNNRLSYYTSTKSWSGTIALKWCLSVPFQFSKSGSHKHVSIQSCTRVKRLTIGGKVLATDSCLKVSGNNNWLGSKGGYYQEYSAPGIMNNNYYL